MAENVPNLGRDIVIQVHEAYRCANRFNPKKTSLRHIKLLKIQDKERILKATRVKELITYRELP